MARPEDADRTARLRAGKATSERVRGLQDDPEMCQSLAVLTAAERRARAVCGRCDSVAPALLITSSQVVRSLLDLERLAQVAKEQLPLFRVRLREVLEPPLDGGEFFDVRGVQKPPLGFSFLHGQEEPTVFLRHPADKFFDEFFAGAEEIFDSDRVSLSFLRSRA